MNKVQRLCLVIFVFVIMLVFLQHIKNVASVNSSCNAACQTVYPEVVSGFYDNSMQSCICIMEVEL